MKSISLIFPHQLFRQHPALELYRPVVLLEEWLYFRQYHFHQQKLMLHRASMRWYAQLLREKGYQVAYVEATDNRADIRDLIQDLYQQGYAGIYTVNPSDDWLLRRMQNACNKRSIELTLLPNPNFLNEPANTSIPKNGKQLFYQTGFYIQQRKQRKLLLDAQGGPIGGQWTFDADNRQKFPAKGVLPGYQMPQLDALREEAIDYVQKNFAHHYGSTAQPFAAGWYPINFEETDAWLQHFFQQRFHDFGIYEDAMVPEADILFHSVLTPMLNIGLINPDAVIDAATQYAAKHDIPLNSLEGFIRQIIGWREFMHLVYHKAGRQQRTKNYWHFSKKIPAAFWKGETGIVPIDIVIKRVLQSGYCHHIERLMVLGNFMLLCEFDPDEVYRWFMELFIDAYDWVMVPNVYGMTQFADGGLITTKPYISGSNYLMKMGNWPKGSWQEIWDALFWRFMHVHRDFFLQNPRLGMLIKTFDKMPEAKRNNHLRIANDYLTKLDRA